MKLKTLDLFAGIGGFSLGLEQTGGFETVAFCEKDEKAQAVLKKHWPNVPVFDDVQILTKDMVYDATGVSVDLITGGFPCQDISTAGKGAGLAGKRSGLWFQFHRLIDEIQPRYALIENVSALRSRGLDQVLWSLAEIGYDAEWHCIPASALGAPHQRDRIWIVAYPHSAHSEGGWLSSRAYEKYADAVSAGWWAVEPPVGRVANGLPGQSHRLKQLGNAVVPQIPQLLGEAILAIEATANP
jgi:DNA (cytosine-5)-methyltransferase 1